MVTISHYMIVGYGHTDYRQHKVFGKQIAKYAFYLNIEKIIAYGIHVI